MKVATQVTKIKAAISKGLATQHPVKLVAGLGLGAVLMAGTALHFVPNSNNESGSAFSSDQQRAAERHQENLDILEATRRSNWDRPLLDIAIERLERKIDSMLADAARDPSRNTPQLNRQIERLDNEIDMLRLSAMQNQSADRPLSSKASGTWPPDTEYYLDPDYRVEAQRK